MVTQANTDAMLGAAQNHKLLHNRHFNKANLDKLRKNNGFFDRQKNFNCWVVK